MRMRDLERHSCAVEGGLHGAAAAAAVAAAVAGSKTLILTSVPFFLRIHVSFTLST